MKKALLLLIIPFLLGSSPSSTVVGDIKWLTDFDAAIQQAGKEDKNILVYFTGSDWCKPCKVLKRDLFDTPEFGTLSDRFVLLYIDIPRNMQLLSSYQMKHNKDLLGKYNKKGVFPLLKIINPKGKELDEYAGYSMNGVVKYHLQMLHKYK